MRTGTPLMEEFTLVINEEQGDLIIKAIDAYAYATSGVMSYDEVQQRKIDIIEPILLQMPDEWF